MISLIEVLLGDDYAATSTRPPFVGKVRILAKRDDSNQQQKVQYQLALKPDMELSYCVNVGGGNNWWYPSTGIRLKPNQWYRISSTYDALLRQVTLRVDGELVKTFTNVPVVHTSANPVRIGWTGWSNEYFNGEIRNVRLIDGIGQKIVELKQQGVDHPVLMSANYRSHLFIDTQEGSMRGTAEATVLNPSNRPRKVTLRLTVGSRVLFLTTKIPAEERKMLSCKVPEPAADTQAQLELLLSLRKRMTGKPNRWSHLYT